MKSQPNLNIFSPVAVKGQENGKRFNYLSDFKKGAKGNTKKYYSLQFSWPS